MTFAKNPSFVPMGISLWDRPAPGEPPHGLLLHLTELNCYPYTSYVERETGLSMSALHHGHQLELLANTIGCPMAEVAKDSFCAIDEKYVTIRGETIGYNRDYNLTRRRICPKCIVELPRQRFIWDIAFISSCPQHGVELVDHCMCEKRSKLTWSDGRIHGPMCCHLKPPPRDPAVVPAAPGIVAMDRYFAGRLGVGERIAVPALDEVSIYEAIDLVARIGGLAKVGYSTTWQGGRNDDLAPAETRALGFKILYEDRLQQLLDKVFSEFQTANPSLKPRLTSAYGWFYHWYNLKGHQQFSIYLTEQLFQHACSKFRVDVRAVQNKTNTLSRSTIERIAKRNNKLLSFAEVKRLCGNQHFTMVRRLADAYGLVRNNRQQGLIVEIPKPDAEVMAWLFDHHVDQQRAGEILSVRSTTVKKLAEAGVLQPILYSKKNPRIYWYLDEDILALVGRLEDKTANRTSNFKSSPINGTSRHGTLANICLLLLQDVFQPSHIDDAAAGLARIHIRSDQAKEFVDAAISLNAAPPTIPSFDHWRLRKREIDSRSPN